MRKWQTCGPEDTDLLIEDLDGSEAEGTARFRLDGTEYEIDLNAGTPRRCGMRCRHVRAAQPAGGGARWPACGGRRATAGGVDSIEVREWANAQGIEVKDRGRGTATSSWTNPFRASPRTLPGEMQAMGEPRR